MNVLEQNTLIRLCITSKETAFYFWLQFWSQTTNCIVMNALMKSSQVFLFKIWENSANEQYFLPIKRLPAKIEKRWSEKHWIYWTFIEHGQYIFFEFCNNLRVLCEWFTLGWYGTIYFLLKLKKSFQHW